MTCMYWSLNLTTQTHLLFQLHLLQDGKTCLFMRVIKQKDIYFYQITMIQAPHEQVFTQLVLLFIFFKVLLEINYV